ncbi:MAG: oligosaccharide flippase family protein [Clostridiales bacterium]|nr:oligosaccharide flippase family protein [Clostridiales bacterium]
MGKLRGKYNSLSPSLKVSLWFVICNVIQKAALILTTPIYSRIMTTEQFGEYKVFLSWVDLVIIFTTLDIFYGGYNVGMEKFRDDRKTYTSAMYGLCFAITTLWVVTTIPFASVLGPLLRISPLQFRLLLIYMYIFPAFQFWAARKKYDYQYKPLIIVTALSSFGTIFFGTLAALFVEGKSDGAIIAKIVVEAVIAVPILLTSVRGIKSLYNKFYWKYALKFNIPLVPHYLSTMILNHSDILMIDMLCGKTDAAIYSVAYSVAVIITVVQNAVNSAIIPWMYKKLRENDLSGFAKVASGVIGAMAVLNLSLVICAPEAVMIMGSAQYAEAVYVIPPVTFGIFLTSIYGFFMNIELYYHNNKYAAAASVIAATSNIVLNFIFIQKFGYMAAGYTTFASYLLLLVMHFFGLRSVSAKNNLSYRKFFDVKAILMIILGFAIGTVVISFTYNFIWLRLALITLIIILIVACRKKIGDFAKQFIR